MSKIINPNEPESGISDVLVKLVQQVHMLTGAVVELQAKFKALATKVESTEESTDGEE